MITYKPTNITINTFKRLKKQPAQVKNAMRKGLYSSGKHLTKDLKTKMTKRQVSGRKYQVYVGLGGRRLVRPRTHTASKASEIPAIITGKLRKSIGFDVRGATRMVFGSKNFAKEYAKPLERRNKYIQRTADKNAVKVKTIITNFVNL